MLPLENVSKHVNKAFRGFEPEPKGSKTCFDKLNFLTLITPISISPLSSPSSLSTLSSISVPLHSISLYHFHFNFNVGLLKTKTSKGDPPWDQSLARPPNLPNPPLQQNESLPPGVRSLKPPGQDVKTTVRSPLTNIIQLLVENQTLSLIKPTQKMRANYPLNPIKISPRAKINNPRKQRKQPNSFETNLTLNDLKNFRKHSTFIDARHQLEAVRGRLTASKDIESNPGPENQRKGSMLVTSYNVRGLGDQNKLRHLINDCYKNQGGKNKESIFCFQETYLENPGRIPFLWRGNFYLTPGLGNSLGCLTLLDSHVNIIQGRSVEDRSHVLACQKIGDPGCSFILANAYAPNANNQEKIRFFEQICDLIADFQLQFNCNAVIMAGDLNLIFKVSEAKNRSFSSQEKNIARTVKNMLTDMNFKDSSDGKSDFYTWRRPNSDSFSKIDRIFFTEQNFTLVKIFTNWSLSLSDHAAVIVELDNKNNSDNRNKTRISRIDASIFQDPIIKEKLIAEISEMYRMASQQWDPHLKLEYLKMCIRKISEKYQAERKLREKSEEELLNTELDLAVSALGREDCSLRNRADLIDLIEELRARKALFVDEKGKRLAERCGTRWYNEGEKSTRYFMRLLNRPIPDRFVEIEDSSGQLVKEETSIEKKIVNYYKNLYENYDKSKLMPDGDPEFFSKVEAVPENEANEVVTPISVDELATTLLTCKDSSPGPDGISYSIWRHLWLIAGPVIVNAWNYSLTTGNTPPSHKLSYLKLIPKAGKDLKKLTNWRPITLSNCDHKIITKTYSKRLCEKLKSKISDAQTAYLKGRLINDNIRSLMASINVANDEGDIDAIITSLDAKKPLIQLNICT